MGRKTHVSVAAVEAIARIEAAAGLAMRCWFGWEVNLMSR